MDKPVEVTVGELLVYRGEHLAAAESCTGGLFSHIITNVSGASTYYLGGVIAYSNEAKVKLLGVRWDTLNKYGAVSEETVIEMARGARTALVAEIGISVSGIAGPTGGTKQKPVGTVWIGLSSPNQEYARHFHWTGTRLQIKEQAAHEALVILLEYLIPA